MVVRSNRLAQYFVPNSYSFMKPELVEGSDRTFPLMLNLEPNMTCNLKCFMCPTYNGETKSSDMRKKGYMTWELFTKIVDECVAEGGVKVLNFHKDGESTIHPRFVDMLRYAKQKGAAEVVHFNTNCFYNDRGMVERLLDSGVDDITLSIDAFHRETFLKTKGRDVFHIVQENALNFFRLKREKNLGNVHIRVKMLGTAANQEEQKLFREFWKEVADEVQVQQIHNFGGGLDHLKRSLPSRYPCAFIFYSTAVNWDGTVNVCHRDWKGEFPLGDLNRQTLKEVYNSPEYRKILRDHIEGTTQNFELCKNCDNWSDGPDYGRATTVRLAGAADG